MRTVGRPYADVEERLLLVGHGDLAASSAASVVGRALHTHLSPSSIKHLRPSRSRQAAVSARKIPRLVLPAMSKLHDSMVSRRLRLITSPPKTSIVIEPTILRLGFRLVPKFSSNVD
jgi:hypothetical protein